jgi:glycosyltransferase involved in cell wall biosynthesis
MKKNKNILVLTGWTYREGLVQVYTLPYVRILQKYLPAGYRILFVTMEQPVMKMNDQELRSVKAGLEKEGIDWVPLHYTSFGVFGAVNWMWNFLKLFLLFARRNIRCIHAWCMPAGALGYFLSVVTGKPLVVDSYEPHAEAMVENKTWNKNSLRFKILFWLEKKLSHRASVFIAPAAGMKDYAQKKYGALTPCFFVKPACVDLDYFRSFRKKDPALLKNLQLENKIVCVYAGKFGGIYLTTEVFDFFKVAADHWGSKFQVLLLTNQSSEELKKWAINSGFDTTMPVIKYVSPQEIPAYLALADFAITPVKPVPTKKYCTPIKDGEYWAMGLPVVITNGISDDSEIIEKNDAGYVLKSLDKQEYQNAVAKIDTLLKAESSVELAKKIQMLAANYRNYSIAEEIYKEIYIKLIPL